MMGVSLKKQIMAGVMGSWTWMEVLHVGCKMRYYAETVGMSVRCCWDSIKERNDLGGI